MYSCRTVVQKYKKTVVEILSQVPAPVCSRRCLQTDLPLFSTPLLLLWLKTINKVKMETDQVTQRDVLACQTLKQTLTLLGPASGGSSLCSCLSWWPLKSLSSLSCRLRRPSYWDLRALTRTSSSSRCCFSSSFSFWSCSFAPRHIIKIVIYICACKCSCHRTYYIKALKKWQMQAQ